MHFALRRSKLIKKWKGVFTIQEYVEFWKRYVDFSGRTSRKGFWMWFLVQFIVSAVITVIASLTKITLISGIFSLAVFIPTLAIIVRRLRDAGKHPAWVISLFIPIANFVLIFVLLFFLCKETDYNSQYAK